MAKFTSKGAILKVTVSSVLTTIPQMGDVTFTPGAVERVDVTTHANSVHEVLRAAQGGASIVFNFILPDTGAATWSFSAHVTGFEIGASVEGAIEATVSLETTGAITFTA